MRQSLARAVLLGLALGAVGPGSSEPPPATPVPHPESPDQHVTVPSLPDQPNREGTVKLDGAMPTDSEGYAVTKRLSTDTKPTPAASPAAGGIPAAGQAPPAPIPSIPVGPAPTGKGTTTGANYITVRAFVKSVEAGKSLTVKMEKTGSVVTYSLAPGAKVPAGLKPGELVRVRVQAAGKGKLADRVERIQKP
jgi:hypothetical protein